MTMEIVIIIVTLIFVLSQVEVQICLSTVWWHVIFCVSLFWVICVMAHRCLYLHVRNQVILYTLFPIIFNTILVNLQPVSIAAWLNRVIKIDKLHLFIIIIICIVIPTWPSWSSFVLWLWLLLSLLWLVYLAYSMLFCSYWLLFYHLQLFCFINCLEVFCFGFWDGYF